MQFTVMDALMHAIYSEARVLTCIMGMSVVISLQFYNPESFFV